mmetsp:Transcript_60250/g.99978  ORF Transcript_60250/g.99978 Transcript_60250/m.99978 type:complete len:207 (-) Transcript_60250:687-1307(-)
MPRSHHKETRQETKWITQVTAVYLHRAWRTAFWRVMGASGHEEQVALLHAFAVALARFVTVRRLTRHLFVGLEPALHRLDLKVLNVDYRTQQPLGPFHVLVLSAIWWEIGSVHELGENLGHRNGVLMVRDHLPSERRELGRGCRRDRHRHVVVHLTIDCFQALAVRIVSATTTQEKVVLADGMARRKWLRVYCAALLVEFGHFWLA